MLNLVFFTDYAQLLSKTNCKSAYILYTFYDGVKDSQGMVRLTYAEIREHLGLENTTISNAHVILKKLNLLEEVEDDTAKGYRILPPQELTEQIKQDILKTTKTSQYSDETTLKKRYLDENIPIEFQQILNKKTLKVAYKKLGDLKNAKKICEYFKVDYNTFKILFNRTGDKAFGTKYKQLAQKIIQECEVKPQVPEHVKKDAQELVKYLYDLLSARDVRPVEKNWFIKNFNVAQEIIQKIDLNEAKSTLDWGFGQAYWSTKISSISIFNTQMHTQYKLAAKSKISPKKIRRTDCLPEQIQKKIVGEISTEIEVRTYEDAFMLKQCILEGTPQEDIRKIVEILENAGIVPKGTQNIEF
jgi:hypothetical protein